MEFRKILALRGPNIWTSSPVLEACVELGDPQPAATAEAIDFADRLLTLLPGLAAHQGRDGAPGGFAPELRSGIDLARVLERVALELQAQVGTAVGYGRTEQTAEPGVSRVVIGYGDEAVGRACLEAAPALVQAALAGRPYDLEETLEKLRAVVYEVRLGPNTAFMVEAATARGIPHTRIGLTRLVVLGYGIKQKRIYASLTDRISFVANAIASDKELAKSLLLASGIPVPGGRPVNDADDAWAAAREIGTPVVVKPRDSDYGLGVMLNLTTEEQVRTAYERARKISSAVLVERHVQGALFRVLVVKGRIIAAIRRDPAQVQGDGRSTVMQLVAEANTDPRRGDLASSPLRKIVVDDDALELLAAQGYAPDSVPPEGATVLLQLKPHRPTGGTEIDVTDLVHPAVEACAARAARVIGLEVAGLDLLAEEIGRPLEEQGGVVLEINAGPAIRPHCQPAEGQPRPVAEAIVETIFPHGEDGRIPIVAVTGARGKTTTARLIAHILRQSGRSVGLATSEDLVVGKHRIARGDCTDPERARDVLLNPEVEAAVLEVSREAIAGEGLAFDRCEVAVVTNVAGENHPDDSHPGTTDDLARAKRTVVQSVLPTGWAVLNAADSRALAMAERSPGGVILFAHDGAHPALEAARATGQPVVFARGNQIVYASGTDYAPLANLPVTDAGQSPFQLENALAAAAAAIALGIPVEVIGSGLASFDWPAD